MGKRQMKSARKEKVRMAKRKPKLKLVVNNDQPRGALRLYKSYMFRSKDPVIDELRTLLQDSRGKLTKSTLRQIESDGGPTASCMNGWFFGKTRRPQSATLEAAGRALGFKRVWVKHQDA
jgi:hypothetical protein